MSTSKAIIQALLVVLLVLASPSTAARRSNPAPTFDVMTPLSRTWTLTRTFQGSPPSGSVDRLSGTVKLHLGRDRVARFSSGETGVWGVKARGSAAGKVASGADDENNYDGAFDGGVCLEVEVAEPGDGPIIVYSIPLAPGQYQPQSLRLGAGVISWLPGPFSMKAKQVGGVRCDLEVGKGIVDPGWARGKRWWWKGTRRD